MKAIVHKKMQYVQRTAISRERGCPKYLCDKKSSVGWYIGLCAFSLIRVSAFEPFKRFCHRKGDGKVLTQERDICSFVEEDFLYLMVYQSPAG